ncbi:MAG TPA: hypothetical protein VIY48_16495, partial [Candidatus Paceibacterota bacterium]
QGPSGTAGPQGIQGIQGIQGDQGETGPSILNYQFDWSATGVYQPNDWVAFTASGELFARGWFALSGSVGVPPDSNPNIWAQLSVSGPAGPQGLQGIQGEVGPQGPSGPQGPQGVQGIQGPTGTQGAQGIQGPAGSAGPSGGGTLAGRLVAAIANGGVLTFNVTINEEWPAIPADVTSFNILIDNELMTVTARTAIVANVSTFTVLRGQFGTTATGHNKNALVQLRMLIGAVGPAGPQGPTGSQGPQGPAGAGGMGGVMIWDEGIPVSTGTVFNFRGTPITATISGTVVDVFVTGTPGATGPQGPAGPGNPGLAVLDEGVLLGTGTTMNFRGTPVVATISGTNIDVFITGGSSSLAYERKYLLRAGNLTTGSDTFVDVDASLNITLTVGARRCLILFSATAVNNGNNATCVELVIDGTGTGGTRGMAFMQGTLNNPVPFSYLTDVLPAGTHTFKPQYKSDTGVAATLHTATTPIIFSVMEQP